MTASPSDPKHSRPPTSPGSSDPSVAESFVDSMNSTVSEHGSSSPGAKLSDETIVPTPGQLGRYRLDELLGKGGFGEVWRGFDPVLARRVAIKFPRSDREYPRLHAETLVDEARRVADLKIPGIVPVFDVGVEDGRLFVVYQYLEGGTLAERMTERKFTPAESVGLVAEIAETLHQAHLRDLVHRDIKPANILFDAKGKPFVADFGLATSEREQLRESGNTLGTYAYMSPEQAAGESHRVDARADVYSLGVIFFELLTARLPYVAESASEYLDQVVNREPRPPRTIDDTIPRALEQICLKSLAKKVIDRYSTAADLAHDLREWVQPKRSSSARVRLLLAVSGAAVALCLLVWGIVLAVQSGKGPQNEQVAKTRYSTFNENDGPRVPEAQPATARETTSVFPRELIYPGQHGAARCLFDAQSKGYILSGDEMQLVQCGVLSPGDQTLRVEISQQPWGNCTGIFLGYREETENRWQKGVMQAIFVEEEKGKSSDRKLRLRRWLLWIHPQSRVLIPRHELGFQIVDMPRDSRPVPLELRMGSKGLESVRWNGEELAEFVATSKANSKLVPADYVGPWGILNNGGATLVRVPALTTAEK